MATRTQTAKRAEPPSAAKKTKLRITRNTDAKHFIHWYRMDFADKIHVIRTGVPAQLVGELASLMNMPKEALMASLGLSRATINRKVQRAQALSPEESERVMGMQALIGQVQSMVGTESARDFDAAKWLANWLAAPLPALGGATPASFMDTVEGQKYVGNLLEMTQSGAYA
ncbi:antitoxin Xre-like helix-turn-helix domain-containing protein [Massilia sp. TS11]|uniref:antitoxin Xre-like helix-turn-helix domain-containing protein n=1 Tax=Massilia sp. TS11 TaxID=2908003 RepID=UPI001EDB4565|nr:antitoxin Xre-like helix-turn-helix domain-containing protein [Massilia sp. TS11]MCG2585188.1 DUF2384 domain-containing protein [Massilia sp. TS11]